MNLWRTAAAFASVLIFAASSFAGEPLVVGGANFGNEGEAVVWNPAAMPIQYRVDPGPLSVNPTTKAAVITNSAGRTRVASMFSVWSSVSTAKISFNYAGTIVAAGSYVEGADVATMAQFNDVSGSCDVGTQSPVVFDADGSLTIELGMDQSVIGFAGPCVMDDAGHINAAMVVMNGKMQDGVNTQTNWELPSASFDEAITHEIGHLLGLGHSQINHNAASWCTPDELGGLPLMYPYVTCEARSKIGLPMLASDDVAWISKLYPGPAFGTSYGKITGRVLFYDGVTQAQGVNVIARRVDDPATAANESKRIAVSSVSGFRFTGNPGQSFTANYLPCTGPSPLCVDGFFSNNVGGDPTGSRNPALIGYYELTVTPGTYTVEIEAIHLGFDIGPIRPPISGVNPEFWDDGESGLEDRMVKGTVTVAPGQEVTDVDIIFNIPSQRFDRFEQTSQNGPAGLGDADGRRA